jgi:hypothetical protein
MSWMGGCTTAAGKRYRKSMLTTAMAYLLVLLCCARMVRHGHGTGWELYFWSLLPAIPVMRMLWHMGRYLQAETDEYQRVLTVRALLAGTGTLLGLIVVSDFLRSFTPIGILPPFAGFVTFFMAFGLAQAVQSLQNRTPADE